MKLSKKVVLVTTAVLGELVVGGGLAVGSMNQAANATTKYPQLDNPNWKQVEQHQHDHPSRYTNYKGEGLVDYGDSERAWADNTMFFSAIAQPYNQVGKAAHDTTANIKNSHELYSQIRGNYFTFIVNKGKSVNMKNVNQPYNAYKGKKSQFYRQSGKNFSYDVQKPVYLFTTPNFTKGTMKYKVPAGFSFGSSKVKHVNGNYSIEVGNPVMPYENMYITANKKYIKRFNGLNDTTKYVNKHKNYLHWMQKQNNKTIATQKHFMQLK